MPPHWILFNFNLQVTKYKTLKCLPLRSLAPSTLSAGQRNERRSCWERHRGIQETFAQDLHFLFLSDGYTLSVLLSVLLPRCFPSSQFYFSFLTSSLFLLWCFSFNIFPSPVFFFLIPFIPSRAKTSMQGKIPSQSLSYMFFINQFLHRKKSY